MFSFRDEFHRWDLKNQRPELRNLYNTKVKKGESIRAFPLSNWTELDVWQYIHLEKIPLVPLYFAAERPIVWRDGVMIMVDDDRLSLHPGEKPEMRKVRFRTLGCYPLSGAVDSTATTLPEIIQRSDVCVALDGSLIVADWYDPGVGGHGMGDTEKGRLYRIAPKGSRWSVPTTDFSSVADCVAALASPNLSTRATALENLAKQPEDAAAALTKAFESATDSKLRARLAWAAGMLPGLAEAGSRGWPPTRTRPSGPSPCGCAGSRRVTCLASWRSSSWILPWLFVASARLH